MNTKLFIIILLVILILLYYYIRNIKITFFIITAISYMYFYYYGHTTYDRYLTYSKFINKDPRHYTKKYLRSQ